MGVDLVGERFEFYDEAVRLFNAVPKGGDITADKTQRGQIAYGQGSQAMHFRRDYTDKMTGDFSVLFESPDSDDAKLIGFTPGPWLHSWPVTENYNLHLKLKAIGDFNGVRLALLDAQKNRRFFDIENFKADGNWLQINAALGDFYSEQSFSFTKGIIGCELYMPLSLGTKVWFDDIYFAGTDSNPLIGVTEKPLGQRIEETRETRPQRNISAFREMVSTGEAIHPPTSFQLCLACIELGENLEQANAKLTEILLDEYETERLFGTGIAQGNSSYWLSMDYGANGRIAAGRLYPETESLFLERLWEGMRIDNDIALTRKSTWWLMGSENHDLAYKINSLMSSQIFMKHPDYADKIYPNYGYGGSYGYGKDSGVLAGLAQWADGKDYHPRDHHKAWVTFFREFLYQRAKKGFWVEVRSPIYMRAQISQMNELYTYCDDKKVRKLAGMMLDLIWADWAQDQVSGLQGGSKTRWGKGRTGMRDFMNYTLGSPATLPYPGFRTILFSDYELPMMIWALALDRESLGDFAFLSRRPGEEGNLWPRPKGNERTLMCDTESRFLRYSWVTPDYVIGTQMDHPAAVHSHLSSAARFNGVVFSAANPKPSSNHSEVYPYSLDDSDPNDWKNDYGNFMYRSVQDRNVLITQQSRGFTHIDPTWFPMYGETLGREVGVYMEDVDFITELDGWIFIQKGNAYVAIRPLMGKVPDDYQRLWDAGKRGLDLPPRKRSLQLVEDSYTWNKDKTIIKLKNKHSPIIFEAGRKTVHGSFKEFQEIIISNPLQLLATVVPDYDVVVYTGSDQMAEEIVFNAANNSMPTIGGEVIDYSYPNVFESPYLYSKYDSGVVTIKRNSEKLQLDFNLAMKQ